MKKINPDNIVGTVKAPFLKKTFIHYNAAMAESVDALVKSLISYTPGDVVVLWGCTVVFPGGLPGDGSVTEGAIYYNGEVYQVEANATIPVGVGETLVWNIVTSYDTINLPADPVTYSNGTDYDQHQIDTFALSGDTTGSGLADYNATIRLDIPGDIALKADIDQGAWTTLTKGADWDNATGAIPLQIRKGTNGLISIQGNIVADGNRAANYTNVAAVTGIPAGMVPTNDVSFNGFYMNGSPNIPAGMVQLFIQGGTNVIGMYAQGTILDGNPINVCWHYWQ